MQRPRLTLTTGRTSRILLLAIPAAIALVIAAAAVFTAQRTLNRVSRNAATEHQLLFTLRALDPSRSAPRGPAFEPVASPPAYTSGAFFAGNLYLAGPSGLTVLASDGATIRTFRTGRELPVAPITAMAVGRLRGSSDPQLLLATAGAGLLLLTPSSQSTPALQQLLPASAEASDLTALLPLAAGDLLLGTRHHGVLLLNGASLTPLNLTVLGIDSARLQITALAAAGSASFLVGTRNAGIFFIHAGAVDHATSAGGLPDDQIESIAVAANHAYIGTPIGVADFDLDVTKFRPIRTLAPGLFGHTLAVNGSALTIGTLDQGIQQVPLGPRAYLRRASISAASSPVSTQRTDAFIPTPDALYALADGQLLRRDATSWNPALPPVSTTLTDRNISALAFAPDGTLYVGFFDRGLDLLSPEGTVRHLEDDHLFCINRLALDPVRQTVAAATADGLVLFDSQGNPQQTLTRRDGLIADHVSDIAFTPTGTALATPAGITFLGPAGAESLYAFQGLVNNHVYALASRPGSTQLLAGTLGGLSILQSDAVQRSFTVSNSSLKHNWITALLPTANNTTLVGTYGAGLETLDSSGRFTPIELPAGTPRDLIINPNALYATPTHLFAGTLANGLLIYSDATGQWSNITTGLPSLNITAFAARAGELYIGTENGLVRIPETNLP
jgi:hypothetical protein